ncbi:CidA/LrgA family protein [Stutzerimonas azotifigens]|uniref:CidA/LrgA family protein n=1 Tax=Stutzerimonas azotifigens TaxID=291995 RepID=A0ABR5YX42_9GAMM|nr:CidA/LrgA family protein [Stutzerimonas azotifigens]MBA1272485.1 CidA/LrgA family protein [Stutzerimonas azotifigens]
MILKGLTWLVLLQLLGSVLNLLLLPALPGPIIGMALLFGWLLLRRGIPQPLEQTAGVLLQYLPLLLVVPATGIMVSGDALLGDLPAIAAGLVVSLLVTVPFCGWLMQRLAQRMDAAGAEKDA